LAGNCKRGDGAIFIIRAEGVLRQDVCLQEDASQRRRILLAERSSPSLNGLSAPGLSRDPGGPLLASKPGAFLPSAEALAVIVYQPTPKKPDFSPLPLYYLAMMDAIYPTDGASCDLCRRRVPLERAQV
jgi:hypothetical protein